LSRRYPAEDHLLALGILIHRGDVRQVHDRLIPIKTAPQITIRFQNMGNATRANKKAGEGQGNRMHVRHQTIVLTR
jgi:hypothetical protein